MYHFKEAETPFNAVALDEYVELSGHTVRYLKDFQISALRFLYNRFCMREFCILNDEHGLGKTATSAVLLGAVAINKNCLIVVNNDERVINWRFHLNVLTDLNVNMLHEEKDYENESARGGVFIAKWQALRVIGDMSKMSFDIVVLDNRDNMLNNTFCVSTLLKCLEKKVQLVISSVDITSDVKLVHNILRLGGNLEHQFENFNAFEKKFYLPDLKAITSKKSNLEEYFLKREILTDYCRGFRMRRYRHQYEHMLPLVDPERYKAHLTQWSATLHVPEKDTILDICESLPMEMGTEELLQQFQNQINQLKNNQEQLNMKQNKIQNDVLRNGEESLQHNDILCSEDVNDEAMIMSPLIYLSESSNSEAEVVFINSADTGLPVVEINDDYEKLNKDSEDCVIIEQTQQTASNELKKHLEKSLAENKVEDQRKEKDFFEMNSASNFQEVETTKEREEIEASPKPLKPQVNDTKDTKVVTRHTLQRRSTTSVESKIYCNEKNSKESINKTEQSTSRNDLSRGPIVRIKKEKSTPQKCKNYNGLSENSSSKDVKTPLKRKLLDKEVSAKSDNAERSTTPERSSHHHQCITHEAQIDAESSNDISKKKQQKSEKSTSPLMSNSTKRTINYEKEVDNTESTHVDAQKRQNGKVPKPKKTLKSYIQGVPQRETRNMKRATRSTSSKRKHFKLQFEEEIKSKAKATPKKSPTSKDPIIKDETKESNKKNHQKGQHFCNHEAEVLNKVSKGKSSLTATQELSVASVASSDYEEIQCGQKLVFDSSTDNSPSVIEKPIEFLIPSTPPSMRLSNSHSLLQDPPVTKSNILFKSVDNDVAVISSSSNKNPIIVLSSSQDETSRSSQTSNEQPRETQLNKRKRKRLIKRMSTKEPSNFRNALSKHKRNKDNKSPDLFSIGGSDIASNNAIPFTQIHCNSITPTPSTAFGFKIFGSEVRSPLEIASSKEVSAAKPKPRTARSCLNLLDETLEKQDNLLTPPNAMIPDKEASEPNKNTQDSKRKRAQQHDTDNIERATSTSAKRSVTPHQSMHERNDLTADDIFEITNNATFGSTLRINASGNISPVQQLNNSHHNKITNYLIGNGNGKTISIADDEDNCFVTPRKIRLSMTQQPGCNVTIVPNTKKSPKSSKSTQATKLTKWFRRNSVDEPIKATNESRTYESKAAKISKRRRLDLSCKS